MPVFTRPSAVSRLTGGRHLSARLAAFAVGGWDKGSAGGGVQSWPQNGVARTLGVLKA